MAQLGRALLLGQLLFLTLSLRSLEVTSGAWTEHRGKERRPGPVTGSSISLVASSTSEDPRGSQTPSFLQVSGCSPRMCWTAEAPRMRVWFSPRLLPLPGAPSWPPKAAHSLYRLSPDPQPDSQQPSVQLVAWGDACGQEGCGSVLLMWLCFLEPEMLM